MLAHQALKIFLLFIGYSAAKPITLPSVKTKNGTYVGRYELGYNQDFFLGVPYAQPPVGNLRYRTPYSLNTTWDGSREAQQYSAGCFGYYGDDTHWNRSEDCLYLNIVRPSGCEGQKLPVAFWIHGGGFVAGSSIDQRYNLSFIVENSVKIGKPVIGVSINYRLSAWGFLASNELAGEGATNLGLRDQRLAMHWVQENILAFGGDPKKVTIWGESAGSQAVGFHLAAYGGRDDKLFRGAIMESGNPVYWISLKGPDFFQSAYDDIVGLTGCNSTLDTLQCLRELPVDELQMVINSTAIGPANWTTFAPVMDGDFLQRYTSLQLDEGQFVKVPILSGTVTEEGTLFSPYQINTTSEFYDAVTSWQNFPAVSDSVGEEILKLYPDDPKTDGFATLGDSHPPGYPWGVQFARVANYYGDGLITAGRRQACQAWAKFSVPAYCFRFNALNANSNPYLGVQHGSEIPFVFLNLDGIGYTPYTKNPFAGMGKNYTNLAYFISSSWASFVSDLDPNAWRKAYMGNEAIWLEYSKGQKLMVLDANVTSFTEPDTWRREAIKYINDHSASVYHR